MLERLVNWGFDSSRLNFAFRTAMASCIALFIGWSLGLDHPSWAAMSVWAASQPGRGMLIEKGLFRILGTLIGTLAGLALMHLCGDQLFLLVIGLAIWVGLCTGAGNVIHGLFSYCTLLSGYSASLVVLLSEVNHQSIWTLGADRFLTVLTGVIVALVVGLIFAHKSDEDALIWRLRALTVSVLRTLQQQVRQEPLSESVEQLLLEAAQIEEALDPHSAGSLRSRRAVQSMRAVVFAHISLLTILAEKRPVNRNEELADYLQKIIEAHDHKSPLEQVLSDLTYAIQACDTARLAQGLSELKQALSGRHAFNQNGHIATKHSPYHIVLHRDWVSASQAMYRTGTIILLAGSGWAFTGSPIGAYVLLGTSVMVTLFSTFESPALIMKHIALWQVVAVSATAICQLLLWPLASTEWQMLLMMVPFILLITLPFAHPKVMSGSMDYVMIFLLLSTPSLPYTPDAGLMALKGVAIIAGPTLALLAFKLIFPTNLLRRQQVLMQAMWRSLSSLASDTTSFPFWQARMKHRVVRLTSMTRKTSLDWPQHGRAGLGLLMLGQCVENWRREAVESPEGYHQSRHQVWCKHLQQALRQSPQDTLAVLNRYAEMEKHRTPHLSAQASSAAKELAQTQPLWSRWVG
ncbi:FUSC family protein [Vibrio sp. EA2]|uniref:FUSC family protein n=1 Tax=Vibrio sp. EA2 TaxID=3079860 RepID=UPI0029498B78|nr:FUSC family protein [Vibrio sp. EA2]MDV6249905.1 FUSC family protein [Vibrio sp. EA2]